MIDLFLTWVAHKILKVEATDGEEPTVETRKERLKEIPPERPLTEAEKAASKQRAAKMDKEFWESQ